jgi:Uma2 family endonuclease
MGCVKLIDRRMTVQEYFELDGQSDSRYEYYDGEVYAMSGTTFNHNDIVGSISSILRSIFRPRGCRAFAESVKLKVSDICYLYPDVVVTCAAKDLSAFCIVEHPSIVVEVISKTSAKRDRVFKLNQYKSISALRYYLIVDQAESRVECYARLEGSDLWTYRLYENSGDIIRFDEFNFEMGVKAIYEDIDFVDDEFPDDE